MRASLRPARRESAQPPPPLLDPSGARVILGVQPGAPVAPIVATADSLFGPRGACLARPEGPLVVCDTGHHRLLVWNKAPAEDGAPADIVIGQPDFLSEGRNAKGEPGAATLNVPTAAAVNGDMLAVADAWNNRVLLWYGLPTQHNQPADVVVGQSDFHSTAEETLKWPYGVAFRAGGLCVADTGHRRVLVWESVPQTNGKKADQVLGEGMRWPHGIAACGERWFVADAGANRVFSDETSIGEDLNMPYGVTVQCGRLVVADTANSRLLGFDLEGGPARRLAGQQTFDEKGENRWRGGAARDSLCWPYGVAACGRTLVVADAGNNRVLLWDMV